MPRQTKARRKARPRQNPALKARKLVGDRLESPVLDWNSPPATVRLPDIEQLVGLNDHELLDVLQRFGIVESWTEAETAAAKYIERVSARQWTPAELKAETRRIAGLEPDGTTSERGTRRAVRSLAKRTYREYGMAHMIKGEDPAKAEFIRLTEGGDSMCDACAGLAGEVGTLAHHASIGMPGSSSCYGGDECQCTLMRYD